MNETIGQRIQRLRKAKGLTQEDVAKRITISPQAVSKWENDASSPDITMIGDLADILGVSVDELLGRETSSKENTQAEQNNQNKEEETYTIPEEDIEEDKKDNKNKKNVNISDEGIHIVDDDGSEVHIDNRGIHIKDNDGRTHEMPGDFVKNEKASIITSGTLMGLALIAYILVGLLWKDNNIGWKMGWTFILDAIWLGSIPVMIRHQKLTDFAYPLIIVSAYCKLGFLGDHYGFEGWGFYWFLFITIPAYYLIAASVDRALRANRERK